MADSRIVPHLLTGTGPGELFVERNPGALVPVYSRRAVGVSASIEYAIQVLAVRHIIVCGHSDCGAMKATLQPEKAKGVPVVARWLSFAKPAVPLLGEKDLRAKPERLLETFTKQCIRVQLEHLLTHPAVRAAASAGKVTLAGAYYDIGTVRISRVARRRG